jgi:hypothetical protein
MKKVFGLALGILTAIGGFLDIGDLVTNAVVGSRFGFSLGWAVVVGVIGICIFAQMSGRVAATTPRMINPSAPTDQGNRWLDAQLHLLDRQVLDVDGIPVAVVDDLELSDVLTGEDLPVGTPPPVITALLSGPVLGTRIFGGRPPQSRLHRTPWTLVSKVGVVIRLAIRGETTDLTWTERWVRVTSSDASPEDATIPSETSAMTQRLASEVIRDHHRSAGCAGVRPRLPRFRHRCPVPPRHLLDRPSGPTLRNRCQPTCPVLIPGLRAFRRTVAVADRSPGAVAASRFVPRAMGGHRAARRTPDQSPTGIH